MASTYYNSSGKEVSDGDIAYADDLNSINSAVDAAFQLAEADIVAAGGDAEYWAGIAEGHAGSAEADATQTAADRVQTGSDRSSATASASSATSSASTASTAASTATTKAALAEQWAEESEDVPVTTGKYSAKHWAAKAQASAGIQTLTGTGVDNTDPNNPVISITKGTISLGNVDNTSDANKPVSTATQTALNLKANLASPTLTGTPAAPTATAGTNTTQIATTAFVIANGTPSNTIVSGLNIEGGVDGGDVTVSANTLTISKTSCLSSDRSVKLSTTSDSTVVLPSTVNQDFYVFIVRVLAGTFECRAYTTYAGPASDAQINAWRFISYAKNNGSGVTMPYRQVVGRIDWLTSNRPILTASVTASYASYDVSAVLPTTTLCWGITVVPQTTPGLGFYISNDGTTDSAYVIGGVPVVIPVHTAIFIKYGTSSAAFHVTSITLRR